MLVKQGFYTALGTPVDAQGQIVETGLRTQIDQQIAHEASGLLLMGSMGMQPAIRAEACRRAVEIAADEVKGRVPLFVGAMDNSIARVRDRIEAFRPLPLDGVVITTPYYFTSDAASLVRFFTAVADASPYPVYLYDLPVSTKQKITYPMVRTLAAHRNIAGIKTADVAMILQITHEGEVKADFSCLYSGLDTVDVGCLHGINRYLDGMFACTPKNAQAMERCRRQGDAEGVTRHLRNILLLRDTMARFVIFPSFTVVMNRLGMPGAFAPDYEGAVSEEGVAVLTDTLRQIGEL